MTTQTTTAPQTPVVAESPIPYGFKQTLNNWKFWTPLALLFMLLSMAMGAISGIISGSKTTTTPTGVEIQTMTPEQLAIMIPSFIIATIISIIMGGLFYRNTLRQIDHDKNPTGIHPPSFKNWTKDIKWKNYILTSLLVAAIALGVMAVLGGFIALAAVNASAPIVVGLVILSLLILIFATPFISFAPLAALDGYGPKESISTTFNAVKTRYWKVIGTLLLTYLIMFGIFTLAGLISLPFSFAHPMAGLIASTILSLIASVIVLPAVYLIMAKLYDEVVPRIENPVPQTETIEQ